MTAKHARTDATILAEIRRLRQLLERRKLVRTQTDLTEARREIEMLRAQLRKDEAETATAAPIVTPPPASDRDRS